MPRSPSNVALVPLVQTKVPLLIASFVFASAFTARKVLHLALCLPKSIPATENWAHRFIKLFRRYPWTTFTWYPSHGAPPVGLEPTTPRLTAVCSTDWAIRAKYSLLTRRDSNHLLLYPTLAALPDISYTPAMNIHRASWIRTNEVKGSKPSALPLGDGPTNNLLQYEAYDENRTHIYWLEASYTDHYTTYACISMYLWCLL